MENMKNGSLFDDAIMMDNYHIYYCNKESVCCVYIDHVVRSIYIN